MGIAVSVTYSITGRGEYQTQREKKMIKKRKDLILVKLPYEL